MRERPIRLVEVCAGILLIVVAALGSDDGRSLAFLYFLGALLLFLTLYSYLNGDRPRR